MLTGFVSSFFTRASAGEYGVYSLIALGTTYAEILGISESHYSGIEQGVQNPSYTVIEAFTKAFGSENVKIMTERG